MPAYISHAPVPRSAARVSHVGYVPVVRFLKFYRNILEKSYTKTLVIGTTLQQMLF